MAEGPARGARYGRARRLPRAGARRRACASERGAFPAALRGAGRSGKQGDRGADHRRLRSRGTGGRLVSLSFSCFGADPAAGDGVTQDIGPRIEEIYRAESRRVFATLVRLLGDFDLAEEALHDAFRAALEQWPSEGLPSNPRAWLVSAGRFKAIDGIRRRARFTSVEDLAEEIEAIPDESTPGDKEDIEDDRLRLIFTCCHPTLAPDAQVALTLREVCGLTTEEIAQAFLTGAPTLAQRIVRAKAKIRDAHIPYEVPGPDELPQRLDSVLRVIYLVFNEGYSASSGSSVTRVDLSGEAIRLGRLLVDLLPEPEAIGLLG